MPNSSSDDLTIVVRDIAFPLHKPNELDPVWIKNQTMLSYFTLALSLYNPYVEPYLVKSMRAVTPLVNNVDLQDKIDLFCRQEAQHYTQHEKFNKLVRSRDYPGLAAIEAECKQQFNHWSKTKSMQFNVGFAEGFESYTSQGAMYAITSGLLDGCDVDSKFSQLFIWHLVEELEHRTVVFDVWQEVFGSYLMRLKMSWFAQRHMLRFTLRCMNLMSQIDTQRYGNRYRISKFKKYGLIASVYYNFIQTYLPGYSPHKIKMTEEVRMLASHFSSLSRS